MYLQVLDGEIVGVLPDKTHPISRGKLCIKGWNAGAFVQHKDRLTTPLIRRGDALEEATWEEALALVNEIMVELHAPTFPGRAHKLREVHLPKLAEILKEGLEDD